MSVLLPCTMARCLALPFLCLLHLLAGGQSLEWEHQPFASPIVECAGGDVMFPWRFRLEAEEDLIGVSWSHLGEGEDKLKKVAESARSTFRPSNDRISLVGNAGLKITNIQPSDSGLYVVYARLLSAGLHELNASLVVAEPPKTKNGRLEVYINSSPLDNDTDEGSQPMGSEPPEAKLRGDGTDRLICGQFTDLGKPPVSVVWEDPDLNVIPSTTYDRGFFILDLPRDSKGGNYHCLLDDSAKAKAVSCLPSGSPLRQKVLVGDLKKPAPVVEAGLSVGWVVGIAIAIVVIVVIIVMVLVIVARRRRIAGKSYAPKEPDSPGPDQEETLPFKT